MRFCLTANTDWYLFNFRLDLARALVAAGHAVSLVCPDGPYVPQLRAQGFTVCTFTAPPSGFAVAGIQRALREITASYRELAPDLVHLFTPLCVLLGAMAAHRTGVRRVVAALTGLGHVFTTNSLKARAARPLLRSLFRRQLARPGTAVIFQNTSDRDEMIAAGVVRAEQCHLVRGSGVDPRRFRPGNRQRDDHEVRLLFASRLLREKGLDELLAAFELVHGRLPHTRLWVAGEVYPANPSSYTAAEVQSLAGRAGVRILGQVGNMPELLGQVDMVVLPSWREGTPKILLEAAACGLPIVATDIPGCRGLVQPEVNGLLVPPRDAASLAQALLRLCADEGLRARFGAEGRRIVTEGFSSEQVVAATLAVYASLGA